MRVFYFALLVYLLLPTPAGADELQLAKDDARLSRVQGRIFLDGTAYSGKLISYRDSGEIASASHYLDGKRDGLTQSWYGNGQLNSQALYKAGRREGESRSWWPNGQLQYQRMFVNGLLEGLTLEWNENGGLKYEQNYESGREQGIQRGWHEDGEAAFSYVFRDGRRYGVIASKPCYSVNPEAGELFNENL